MTEYLIAYEVNGAKLAARVPIEYGIDFTLKALKREYPNVKVLYIILVSKYSNGFNIELFQLGGWEVLLK